MSSTNPTITATSQTSRFHVDTISTLSSELDLKQVNIAIGNEDLLVDAHVRFKAGVRYGLVGRNGEGKSTLLQAISKKLIPGLPENLGILLVSQIEGTDPFSVDGDKKNAGDYTVTQRVVMSDQRREDAMREHRVLSQALENGDVNDLAKAVATLELERSKIQLEDAKKIALKRSGARGADARKKLLQAEVKVTESEERANSLEIDDSLIPKATGMLEDIQNTLDVLDAASTEARAQSILIGLGFPQEQLTAKFSTLSGGWRSRCSLASALLQKPDVLLLDECTNYLDMFSVVWLTEYLISLPCTIVLVAHDRDFLDAVCEEIVILKDKTLHYYVGTLTEVEREQKKKRKGKLKMQSALDKRKAGIEKSISEGARRAKQTGDDALSKQVKMRKKKLEERWGMEKNDKGHRFKLNDNAGYFESKRMTVQIDELERDVSLPFPDPEPMRFPGALISATDVSFKYTARGPVVVQGVDIKVHPGSRVALVGRNGEGKSTIVKLLTGTVKPTTGKVEHHPRLRFACYDQHSVESLSVPEYAKRSAVEHFIDTLKSIHNIDVDVARARAFLGSYGLGKKATNPISSLSGGQKVRLALALVVYPAPDCLVLDEVSTHLDLYTVAALVRGLRAYTGAVVLVSHDRHLVRCVVEGAPLLPPSEMADDDEEDSEGEDRDGGDDGAREPGRVYLVAKGKVRLLNGVDDYVALVEKRVRKLLS
ncbi:P-loop containing nucleoside triphosphate hydrolase protein [Auricularia subglabra TFB-10046 SS5]|nr:P-loop containing nucleoside triphosphate hydrolase protein [Auricularia subglabra TFB-10046 SS5]